MIGSLKMQDMSVDVFIHFDSDIGLVCENLGLTLGTAQQIQITMLGQWLAVRSSVGPVGDHHCDCYWQFHREVCGFGMKSDGSHAVLLLLPLLKKYVWLAFSCSDFGDGFSDQFQFLDMFHLCRDSHSNPGQVATNNHHNNHNNNIRR